MSDPGSAEERYARLVDLFVGRRNVTQEGRGFGSSALRVDGRIFAMLSSRSEFVVKLPRARVHELIQSGDGRAFDAGKGRPMKEWMLVPLASSLDWISIADEALAYATGAHSLRR